MDACVCCWGSTGDTKLLAVCVGEGWGSLAAAIDRSHVQFEEFEDWAQTGRTSCCACCDSHAFGLEYTSAYLTNSLTSVGNPAQSEQNGIWVIWGVLLARFTTGSCPVIMHIKACGLFASFMPACEQSGSIKLNTCAPRP